MTLAVAAPFPWGFARNALKQFLPGGLRQQVVLATDSRWTFADRSPYDMGQKLWKLAPKHGVGAVYAGDVLSGEEAMATCSRRLELVDRRTPDVVAEVASVALEQAYAAHRLERPEIVPLYVLIALAGDSAGASVIRLSSEDGFQPHPTEDLETIGWPTACRRLLAKLDEKEEEFRSGNISWKLDIQEYALRLVATLFSDVIKSGQESTVGGPVQLAIVGPKGWRDLTVARLHIDQIESQQWEAVSVDPGSVKRFTEQVDVPTLAGGKFDIGFVSLADATASNSEASVVRGGDAG